MKKNYILFLLNCFMLCVIFTNIAYALPTIQTEPFPDWALKNMEFWHALFAVAVIFFVLGMILLLISLPFILLFKQYVKRKNNKLAKSNNI